MVATNTHSPLCALVATTLPLAGEVAAVTVRINVPFIRIGSRASDY